jgi:hypothetical protein
MTRSSHPLEFFLSVDLKVVWQEIFGSGFVMDQFPPGPWVGIQRGPFQIFTKICGNIHNIMFITSYTGTNGIFTDSMTPVINLSPVTTMPLLLAIKRLSFPYLFLSYGLWTNTYCHFKKKSQYCPVLISTVGWKISSLFTTDGPLLLIREDSCTPCAPVEGRCLTVGHTQAAYYIYTLFAL